MLLIKMPVEDVLQVPYVRLVDNLTLKLIYEWKKGVKGEMTRTSGNYANFPYIKRKCRCCL